MQYDFCTKTKITDQILLKMRGWKTHLTLHYKLYFWQELNFQFHDEYLERFQINTPI